MDVICFELLILKMQQEYENERHASFECTRYYCKQKVVPSCTSVNSEEIGCAVFAF